MVFRSKVYHSLVSVSRHGSTKCCDCEINPLIVDPVVGHQPHDLTVPGDHLDAILGQLGYEVFGENYTDTVWKEAFIHPKSSHGWLIQLAQWDDDAPMQRRELEDVLADPS